MKLKNIFGVTLAALAFCSCGENFLDVVPSNKLSSATFWKTENDAKMALASSYANWESYMNICFLDVGSDNGYQKNNFWYEYLASGTLKPGLNINTTYGNWVDKKSHCYALYTKIREHNNFLENVPKINMDETLKKQYIAEVRFLRAYDYYSKMMFFGDMPLITNVPKSAAEAMIPRTPQAEIEEFIIKELAECAPDLPEVNFIESQGHVTRGAAYALKARVELYTGRYAEAQESAAKVIAMDCFELYPNYEEMFWETAEGANKEMIMGVKYQKGVYAQRLTQLLPPQTQNGYSSIDITWDMIEAYQMSNGKYTDDADSGWNEDKPFENRDPRFAMTCIYPGADYNGAMFDPLNSEVIGQPGTPNVDNYTVNTNGSLGKVNLRKYVHPVDPGEVNNYDADMPVLRLAEMYIIFAECAVETGKDKDKALQYINLVRDRVGMPAASTLDERLVRYERRVELAFEGLRYFDIKRWDLGPEVFNRTVCGTYPGSMDADGNITWDKSNGRIILETRKYTPEYNYLIPIPQSEMDKNPNMVQNPGY